ncbi:hypothetical protein MRX96_059136 [Rhipicephalus microplus]
MQVNKFDGGSLRVGGYGDGVGPGLVDAGLRGVGIDADGLGEDGLGGARIGASALGGYGGGGLAGPGGLGHGSGVGHGRPGYVVTAMGVISATAMDSSPAMVLRLGGHQEFFIAVALCTLVVSEAPAKEAAQKEKVEARGGLVGGGLEVRVYGTGVGPGIVCTGLRGAGIGAAGLGGAGRVGSGIRTARLGCVGLSTAGVQSGYDFSAGGLRRGY